VEVTGLVLPTTIVYRGTEKDGERTLHRFDWDVHSFWLTEERVLVRWVYGKDTQLDLIDEKP
jgi:hypothetical protein